MLNGVQSNRTSHAVALSIFAMAKSNRKGRNRLQYKIETLDKLVHTWTEKAALTCYRIKLLKRDRLIK